MEGEKLTGVAVTVFVGIVGVCFGISQPFEKDGPNEGVVEDEEPLEEDSLGSFLGFDMLIDLEGIGAVFVSISKISSGKMPITMKINFCTTSGFPVMITTLLMVFVLSLGLFSISCLRIGIKIRKTEAKNSNLDRDVRFFPSLNSSHRATV